MVLPEQWWWWEHLVLGLWMLITLVLTKSYAGNLMSMLAVKYLPQPFQSLRDVVDHPSVSIIWQKSSLLEQYIKVSILCTGKKNCDILLVFFLFA